MRIQTLDDMNSLPPDRFSVFGALRSKNTENRCFAHSAEGGRGPSYPMPLAIAYDAAPALSKLTLTTVKLKHSLLFLSWNLLDTHLGWEFEIGATELSTLMGDPNPRTAQLTKAFEDLCSIKVGVRAYQDQFHVVETPILQNYSYDAGRFKWMFSRTVEQWCFEPASFAWIDLSLIREFRSRHALGLYEMGAALVNRDIPYVFLNDEQFWQCLGIERDRYRQRSDFTKRVVVPSIKSVKEIAPFSVTISPGSRRRDDRTDGYRILVERQRRPKPVTFDVAPLGVNEWALVRDQRAHACQP